MKILLVEPYYKGSHKQWVDNLSQHSRHEFKILSLPGIHWKWRMHGAAITLASQALQSSFDPDLILCTDMLDIATFIALLRKRWPDTPLAVYFHENQLNYPQSSMDTDIYSLRDNHYGFINYTSCLVADKIFFNSIYNQDSFIGSLIELLPKFPDYQGIENIEEIKKKSELLYLGVDLQSLEKKKDEEPAKRAVILWNHRWEHDKNPEIFFKALCELKNRGIDFKLIILGSSYNNSPVIFEEIKEKLKEEIIHFGYVQDRNTYRDLLWKSDIIPVTSNHDFFGVSLVEAMFCNVIPLLPKRLAYPEHIPSEFHSSFFYEDHEDMVNRLQRMALNVKVLRKQEVRKFIEKYDWKNMIRIYDDEFENVSSHVS